MDEHGRGIVEREIFDKAKKKIMTCLADDEAFKYEAMAKEIAKCSGPFRELLLKDPQIVEAKKLFILKVNKGQHTFLHRMGRPSEEGAIKAVAELLFSPAKGES